MTKYTCLLCKDFFWQPEEIRFHLTIHHRINQHLLWTQLFNQLVTEE